MSANTPVVVKAYRTPFGKEDGVFSEVRPEDLSIPLINRILEETDLTGEDVDDLQWGCAQQREEQGNNMARVIALMSELGDRTRRGHARDDHQPLVCLLGAGGHLRRGRDSGRPA